MDLLLDENCSPVARMRLFSSGVNFNTRVLNHEQIAGDKACLACGNCVDACPVVREKHRFIFLQNQRTSMSLEHMVGVECRRCYRCIKSCPQVALEIKEYAAGYRRSEKIIHLLLALTILFLAFTGMTLLHYGDILPDLELNILQYTHRGLGIFLILLPFLYFLLDKRHFQRIFNRVFVWGKQDFLWIKDLIYHIRDHKKNRLPFREEFNPAQKAWYLLLIGALPLMSASGITLWFLPQDPYHPAYVTIKLLHMSMALMIDICLFVHIYIKYLRNWAILTFDIVKVLIKKRHLFYFRLYQAENKHWTTEH